MGSSIFLVYDMMEANLFKIHQMATELSTRKGVEEVYYWHNDLKVGLIEFMSRNLGRCDTLLIFCGPNTSKSMPVDKQWVAADMMGKLIIPVFIEPDYIPPLLKERHRVEFDLSKITNIIDSILEIIKMTKENNVFLSYATSDTDLFRISEIALALEQTSQINKVYYWEKDSGQDIIQFMEEKIEKSKIFVLFCTQNSKNSKSVELERRAALQLKQEGKLRIIPVFQELSAIPLLIKPLLGVKFREKNFEKFIHNLFREINRE